MSVNKALICFRPWSEIDAASGNYNGGNYVKTLSTSKYGKSLDISAQTKRKNGHETDSGSYIFDDVGVKKRLSGGIANDYLCFVQSNSAHQLTYYLAGEVFKQSKATQKLVFNFDQHADTGGSASELWCGTWGGERLKQMIPNCSYSVLGATGKKINLTEEVEKLFIKNYTQTLETGHKPAHSGLDIYVTVDMDVLDRGQGNEGTKRTNWKHGHQNIEDLIAAISLIPNRVIGADVTGFPPFDKDHKNKASIEVYLKDIDSIAAALEGKIKTFGQSMLKYETPLTEADIMKVTFKPLTLAERFQAMMTAASTSGE